jgi:uncharacterized protein YciI
MFIVILTFSKPVEEIDRHLAAHKVWIKKGFDDGVFVLAGSQRPRTGGALLALGDDRASLEARIALDPFVQNEVVSAQILQVVPTAVDERIGLLGK